MDRVGKRDHEKRRNWGKGVLEVGLGDKKKNKRELGGVEEPLGRGRGD